MTGDEKIDEIKQRILAVYPDAKRVVLFGSRAAGTADANSDFDIMVVVTTDLPPAKRVALLRAALFGLGCAFDLLVVTPSEFKHLKNWQSTAISWADKQGIVLHEAKAA